MILIPARHSPFSATLIAGGVAEVLSRCGANVRLRSLGHSIAVEHSGEVGAAPIAPLPWIVTERTPAPADLPTIDYAALWEQRKAETQRLSVARAIVNFGAITAYNGLVECWASEPIDQVLRTIMSWQSFADFPMVGNRKRKDMAPALQIVNPTCGKGTNSAKADGVEPGQMYGPWLAEYLKYLGLWRIALPRRCQGSDDVKIYVLLPGNALDWSAFRAWFEDHARDLWSLAHRRMDIQAMLVAARHAGIAGVQMAYYKSLGRSLAAFGEATYQIPAWLRTEAHQRTIRQILTTLREESHHDQAQSLERLRDAIADSTIEHWSDFQVAYTEWTMRQREPLPLLTTALLEAAILQ